MSGSPLYALRDDLALRYFRTLSITRLRRLRLSYGRSDTRAYQWLLRNIRTAICELTKPNTPESKPKLPPGALRNQDVILRLNCFAGDFCVVGLSGTEFRVAREFKPILHRILVEAGREKPALGHFVIRGGVGYLIAEGAPFAMLEAPKRPNHMRQPPGRKDAA